MPHIKAWRLKRREEAAGLPTGFGSSGRRRLDTLLFSSLPAACVAWVLARAAFSSFRDFGVSDDLHTPVCAAAALGTLAVYNLDRIRDISRDAGVWPARTRFVSENRVALGGLGVASGVGAVVFISKLATPIWLVCAAALALGLLHRRLKQIPQLKVAYVTAAWVSVAVGMPAIATAAAVPDAAAVVRSSVWVAGVYALVIAANVAASSCVNADGIPFRLERVRVWGLAACACSGAVAVIAPGNTTELAWIPAAEALAIAGFRGGERSALGFVDGALIVGGGAAWFGLS